MRRLLVLVTTASTIAAGLAGVSTSTAGALQGTNGYPSAFTAWQHAKATHDWVSLAKRHNKTTAQTAYITEHCGGAGYIWSYANGYFVNAEGWQGGNLSGILRAAWPEVYVSSLFQLCGEGNQAAIYSDYMRRWVTVDVPSAEPEFGGEWDGTLRANGAYSTYINFWTTYAFSGALNYFWIAGGYGSVVGEDPNGVHGYEWGLLRAYLGCCSVGYYNEGLWATSS